MSENNSTPNLKPCPFCGSICVNDTTPPTSDGMNPGFYWVCPCCVACGPVGTTLEGATDGWNTRDNVDPEQIMRDNITTHNEPLRGNEEMAYQEGYRGTYSRLFATSEEASAFNQGAKDRQREKGDD